MAIINQRHNDDKAVMPTVIQVTLSEAETRNGALVMVRVKRNDEMVDDVGFVQLMEDEDYDDDGMGTSNGALDVSAGLLANDDDVVQNTYPEYFSEVMA